MLLFSVYIFTYLVTVDHNISAARKLVVSEDVPSEHTNGGLFKFPERTSVYTE